MIRVKRIVIGSKVLEIRRLPFGERILTAEGERLHLNRQSLKNVLQGFIMQSKGEAIVNQSRDNAKF